MSEVENLCIRMIFLKEGTIAFFGAIEEFKKSAKKTYKVSIKTSKSDKYEMFEIEDLTNELINLVNGYKKDDVIIEDLKIKQSTLEEVFLKFAEEKKS